MDLLLHEKVVTIDGVSCAIVDDRICWVKFLPEGEGLAQFECSMPVWEFGAWTDNFSGKSPEAIRDIPEIVLLIGPDGEHDFTKLPIHLCPKCFTNVHKKNAVLEGRYAHCPNCFRQFYKAPRLDGVADPTIGVDKPKRTGGWGVKKEVEKVVPKTVEEMLAEAKPIKMKIRVG